MSATIQIGLIEATVDGYRWECKEHWLKRVLNAMLDPHGPSGADPNPDLHAAREAVKVFGGQIVSYDETEYDPGAIY